MLRSIRNRLILSSIIPSLIFLGLGAYVILSLALSVQEEEFMATLEAELIQLASWARVNEDGVFDTKLPGQPRFERGVKGWYYQVFHQEENEDWESVASSNSLSSSRLNISEPNRPEPRWSEETVDIEGLRLSLFIQRMSAHTLADEAVIPNPDDVFLIVVARSQSPMLKANRTLQQAVGIGAIVVLGLIGAMLGIMAFFTLGPLRQVENALHRIRSGEDKRLEGDFLREIEPLATEINHLIDENEKVIERARTQVGNLAHALKTPLSILTNEAGSHDSALAATTREQVEMMRAQVDRYLARARVAANSQVIGMRTEIAPVLERLVRVLGKINASSGITISSDVPEGLFLRGEQQDLEEIVGNLLENAFKWAKAEVSLKAARDGDDIQITVEDDGPGLAPDDRVQALERGQRFDETTPGTGLGLSIVADVVSAYGGSVHLEEASLGGLQVIVTLPSAR